MLTYKKPETIVTCATHRNDGFDDPVVDMIVNHLRDNQMKGNQTPPPSTVDELSRFIVRFCINFIHTTTWKSLAVEETPSDWKGGCDAKSVKEIFTDTINEKVSRYYILAQYGCGLTNIGNRREESVRRV